MTRETQIAYYRILKQYGFKAGISYDDRRQLSSSMHGSSQFGFYIVFNPKRHAYPYVYGQTEAYFRTPAEMDDFLNLVGVLET